MLPRLREEERSMCHWARKQLVWLVRRALQLSTRKVGVEAGGWQGRELWSTGTERELVGMEEMRQAEEAFGPYDDRRASQAVWQLVALAERRLDPLGTGQLRPTTNS